MNEDSVVFLVDDDASVRDALTWLIESVGTPVRAYASAVEFLDFRTILLLKRSACQSSSSPVTLMCPSVFVPSSTARSPFWKNL